MFVQRPLSVAINHAMERQSFFPPIRVPDKNAKTLRTRGTRRMFLREKIDLMKKFQVQRYLDDLRRDENGSVTTLKAVRGPGQVGRY